MRRLCLAAGLLVALPGALGCTSKPKAHIEVDGIKKDLPIDVVLNTHNGGYHGIHMYANCPTVACYPTGLAPLIGELKAKCPNVEVVQVEMTWPAKGAPAALPAAAYTGQGPPRLSASYVTAAKDHMFHGATLQLTSASPLAGKLEAKDGARSLSATFSGGITCAKND